MELSLVVKVLTNTIVKVLCIFQIYNAVIPVYIYYPFP